MKHIKQLFFFLMFFTLIGCEDILEPEPIGIARFDAATAITNLDDAELALIGAYDGLQTQIISNAVEYDYYGVSFAVAGDLIADNLLATTTFTSYTNIDNLDATSDNITTERIWNAMYQVINRANNIIERAASIDGANSIIAEAKFLRALAYFDLVRTYALPPTSSVGSPTKDLGVPIVLQPIEGPGDLQTIGRNTVSEVYAQVVADLQSAAADLPDANADGRANKWAATALLARAYLYMGQYAQATSTAESVINSGNFALNGNFSNNFVTEFSGESIFEIDFGPALADDNVLARDLFDSNQGALQRFTPTQSIYNAFEAGDSRLTATLGNTDIPYTVADAFVKKYFRLSSNDDNFIVSRLAEMYLIVAEADAQANSALTDKALTALNTLRERAFGDSNHNYGSGMDLTTFLAAVANERRVELAFENHRSFDLLRTNQVAATTGDNPLRYIFPIPIRELQINGDVMVQNEGY
ncbi:MAG: RagB/SusD family nutrient uptake outer membrane protein [Chitinophagales bacterium]